MKSSFVLFLSFIALCSEQALAEMKALRAKRHLKRLDETCIASIVDIVYEDRTDGQYMTCETPSGKHYKVKNVDKAFIKENFRNGKLVSGNVELSFDLDTMVDESTAEIVSNSLPGFRKKNSKGSKGSKGSRLGRQLQTQVGNCGTYLGGSCAGTRSVLVVRVIADDKTTTASESQLSDSIFGTSGDSLNLKSWYNQCSYNQLNFVPATDENSRINNGVYTVTVSSKSTDGDSKMNNDITAALNGDFGVSSPNKIADHVMYCLPAGTMNGIAYANVNNWRSVYSDNWCTYVSAQAHEIGHNLSLAHSGDPAASGTSATYGDQSGMMGFSYSQDDGPIQCFNAPKNWQLGWYDDKQISVSFEGWQGNLIGLSEIPSADADDMVIVKVDLTESYYVSFNRKTGINSGTTEGGNQVLVHKRDLGTGYAESDILAYLNSGGTYTSPDTNFFVKVNSINLTSNPARANVEINRSDDPPPCFSGTASVSITRDNYPGETSWDIRDDAQNVLATGFSTGASNIVLVDGYYTFSMYDSYGDGICCAYGNGSYTLEVGNTILKAGGEFGSQETTAFGICSGATPTQSPTIATTASPTASPSNSPTTSPTVAPTSSPTESPSYLPSEVPSFGPSSLPSEFPFASPSYFPSEKPSLLHSLLPSVAPAEKISNLPSLEPSAQPSKNQVVPSSLPSLSIAPSKYHSDQPSSVPSSIPSDIPSTSPTHLPSVIPSNKPSLLPSSMPTVQKSEDPSIFPSSKPTIHHSLEPSMLPSVSPSKAPIQFFVDQPGVEYGGIAEMINCTGTNTNMIRKFLDTGYITFTVNLQCTDVDVEVSYLSGANRAMHIYVNTESSQVFDSSETGPWCLGGGTSSTMILSGLSGLKQGNNTITFQNPAKTPTPLLQWIKFKENCLSSPFASPSASPSFSSDKPSISPTSNSSEAPSMSSESPSSSPFASPSASPSFSSDKPSISPTSNPSETPSVAPSMSSESPSSSPFASPSASPSFSSDKPSISPTSNSSETPSVAPSMSSESPSSSPFASPSASPSFSSDKPSISPTSNPSETLTYHYSQLGDDIDGEKTAEFSGSDVAMSASGNRVAVGAEGYYGYKGSTVVFDYDPATGAWGQVGAVIIGPSGSYSGNNIELSNDGSRVAIGAKSDRGDRGSVFIYDFDGTDWNLGGAIQGTIQQGEAGSGLALSGDGSTVAVGSPSANSSNGYVSVHRYNTDTATWDIVGTPFESQTKSRIGGAVGLSLDGNRVVMGGRIHDVDKIDYAGIVRVYDLVDGDWQLSGELKGLDYYDRFGDDVDISDDGTRIMVGAFTSDGQFDASDKRDIGQVMVFELQATGWVEIGNIVGENQSDQLGSSVKMSGDGNVIIMGSPGSDDNGPNAGEIKVRMWNPSNSEFQPVGVDIGGECGGDKFGESVGINVDGSRIIAGSSLNSYYKGHSRVFQVMEGDGDGSGVDNKCPTAKPTASPSNRPSASPSVTDKPSISPTSNSSETPSVAPSMSSESPSSSPFASPSASPSFSSDKPSISPTSNSSVAPSMSSESPSSSPFASPSASPSFSSDKPSISPTSNPSVAPSMSSDKPSISPTSNPSVAPSMSSESPSSSPFASPSASPSFSSDKPSISPTSNSSVAPSMSSESPSSSPFASPSASPSFSSDKPSISPTSNPSETSSASPTNAPTSSPTFAPSSAPTSSPTSAPTNAPTDVVTSSPSLSQGCHTVEVIIVTDNYPAETSWQLTDATSATILSGSDYTTSGATISEEVCVDDWTSLSFTINDSYGDGICCSYGSGSYTVNVNDNTVLSGGSFGSSETKPLQPEACVHGKDFIGGELVCKCAPGEMRIAVDLRTDRYPSETSWAIKTCAGDVVATRSYTQTGTDHTDYICVESSSPYQFHISDSYGDGICCNYGSGNYQLSIDGTVEVSSDGIFGSGEVKDLNGACSSSSIAASDSFFEESNEILQCSSVTKKRKCTGNCEWVRKLEDMNERGLKKGKRRRRGMCKPKEKEEPKKEEPSVPKCAACASTGAVCCGTCVNSGPAFMRGCY